MIIQLEISNIWLGSSYEIDLKTCTIADIESKIKNDLSEPYSMKSILPKKCLPSVI